MKIDFSDVTSRLEGTMRVSPDRRLRDFDARHVALETFMQYVSLLTFTVTNDPGLPAKGFRIPREQLFSEQPGETVQLVAPGFAFIAGEGSFDQFELGPAQVVDETKDVYGPGTVVVRLGDYTEEMNLEAWASNPAQRRSLVAGITEATLNVLQETSSLRLKLPEYFDQVATFTLTGSRYIDDADLIRGRFRAHFRFILSVSEVALVRYTPNAKVYADVETVDGQVEAEAELRAILAARYEPPSS